MTYVLTIEYEIVCTAKLISFHRPIQWREHLYCKYMPPTTINLFFQLQEVNRHPWVTAGSKGELELEAPMMEVVQTHIIPTDDLIDDDVLKAMNSLGCFKDKEKLKQELLQPLHNTGRQPSNILILTWNWKDSWEVYSCSTSWWMELSLNLTPALKVTVLECCPCPLIQSLYCPNFLKKSV